VSLGLPGGHVSSRSLPRAVDPGLLVGNVGSEGMAGAVSLWLLGGHVGSLDMAGAVVSRVPSAMLVSRSWRELWAQGSHRPCWFPGHGGSCVPGSAAGHVGYRGMAAAVGSGVPLPMLFLGAWQRL